ncbi:MULTISPECIES: MaoC/PaaZ C-terminal domain-containing protein [Streptomyces]|jgi:acyl dehydratase|uniref:MaoC/PaaZ C-terminal domain-containing protein n=1 Tax=Streptomyces TaxID=1883 RepID=UPI000F74508D|nr:MaoC/PaaZ C-terminal domain-containing protein [Streptomyces sp. WAC00469]RSS08390.1 3-alpha,7-alpha,12-alpha-trihydroxy-5-beta-cholest-24-enoyl-CoA hydratase [Streptomyces sp. WAC00469]
MPIDAATALAAPPRTEEISWTRKDVQLYHLGIGAGVPATDVRELRYTLESRLQVLPSFATVAGARPPGVIRALSVPGVDVDLARVLHGGQTLTVHRPLPVQGTATTTSRVTAVYDKGTAAVLHLRTEAADADGPLWTDEAQVFVRGEGGWGGDRGSSVRAAAPAGEPALTVDRPVREDQALLYRLSGDGNPLHADPEFARRAGFDRPVLHGLCTYGLTLKTVVDHLLAGEATRVRGCAARFAGVAYPGETLRIRLWPEEPGRPDRPDRPEQPDGTAARAGAPQGGGTVRATVTALERDEAPVLADTVVEYV